MPSLELDGNHIELVEDIEILGVIRQFRKNAEYIIKKAYKRILMIKRLKNLGKSGSLKYFGTFCASLAAKLNSFRQD